MEMDYRARIYDKYASNVQGQTKQVNVAEADRWGKPYDVYLRGWLPTDKKASILVVGCGYGRLLRFLSKRGYTKVTGVDVSPEQVKLARQIHPNVIHGDALEFLKGHKEELDLIAALDFIEHLHKDEVVQFLDSCYRALLPGGRLIIQTANADSPWGMAVRYGDFTHETCFNPNSLEWIMRVCGFTGIEVREQGPLPRGLFSAVRWVLWKFIRLLPLAYNLIETGSCGSGVLSRVFILRGVK